MVYGDTEQEAIRRAKVITYKVIADFIEYNDELPPNISMFTV